MGVCRGPPWGGGSNGGGTVSGAVARHVQSGRIGAGSPLLSGPFISALPVASVEPQHYAFEFPEVGDGVVTAGEFVQDAIRESRAEL